MTAWLGGFDSETNQVALDGEQSQRDEFPNVDFVADGQACDHVLPSLPLKLVGPDVPHRDRSTYAMLVPGKELSRAGSS
jgi:hypothetical protein